MSTVEIPGVFTVEFDGEKITRMTFMPSGSAAGYFGPAAVIVEGDELIDCDSSDGVFWRAMQHAIGRVEIDWEE